MVRSDDVQKEVEPFSITVFVTSDYSVQYLLPSNFTLHSIKCYFSVFVSRSHHLQEFTDVGEQYLWFVDSYGTDLTESNYSQLIMNQPLHMQVRISVRDSMSAIHQYTPKLSDRVQMLVTDIQNCPFVQLPMKITANKEDVSPNTFIWDILKCCVSLRATEVLMLRMVDLQRTEDVFTVVLKEEFTATCTKPMLGSTSIHLPEGAVLVVETEPDSKAQFYTVEYDGEWDIKVPIRMCERVEEVDYQTYETPIVKRVCTSWDSDCPYQLSVKQNQRLSITMENDDYYYGEIIDEGIPSMQGWVQKSLVVYRCFFPNRVYQAFVLKLLHTTTTLSPRRNNYGSKMTTVPTFGMNRSLFTTLAFFFPLPDFGTSVQISFTFSRILFHQE